MSILAQNEVDALRYSQLHFGGTARYSSMAGAFGALGGDISVISSNPAGVAVFRKSEFTFSPSLNHHFTTTSHYGNSIEDYKINFSAQNIGLVATYKAKSEEGGWQSSSLGIAYNRLADYHNSFTIEGTNSTSSLLDIYQQQIESGNFDEFGSNLAWATFLVDTVSGNSSNYMTAIPNYGQLQTNSVTTRGGASEIVVAYGGNYDNRLYIGGTLGIPYVRYIRESSYTETVSENDSTTALQSFTFNEKLTTSGTGMNVKFGMIYRLHDMLRIGWAVHSPTLFNLNDSWNSNMTAAFDSVKYTAASPVGNYDYSLTTPLRAIGSAALILGKHGIISADYEFVDYSMARLSPRFDSYNFGTENAQIRDKYTTASNIRIGGEWRHKQFRTRAGYAHYGNPFNKSINNKSLKTTYSVGFGFREKGYFLDFAYLLTNTNEKYYLYDPDLVAASDMEIFSHSFMATIGFRY